MLLLFFVPLGFIIFGGISNPTLIICLYILNGLGMSGIGMGIMHDAIHGSFSKHKWLNKLMANTTNLIGASKDIWRLQHNVLHHTYTNIEAHDHDIETPFFLRFSPHAEKNKLHKYQHIYAWVFYGLSTLSWVTTKDFANLERFRKKGLIKDPKVYRRYLMNIILCKVIYYTLVLILPLLLSATTTGVIVLGFFVMQFVTGFLITLVFQTAHIMPDAQFPLPTEEGKIENEIMTHQLLTTCNFAQEGRFLFWFFGGLTNQIEHHLFPHVSHIHYRKIAPIVEQTAKEFGIPYNRQESFFSAIKEHFKMLKVLGSIDVKPIVK